MKYTECYIIKKDKVDINAIETQNGFRCLIQDISESGALIRIGGKGVQNVKIKLQFNVHNKLILMVGIVRTVEYNEEQNQSLLHFECTHIEGQMRNEVLKFVYNMMPENEKEVLEALEQTEDDEKAEQNETDSSAAASASGQGAAIEAEISEATGKTSASETTAAPEASADSAATIAAENTMAADISADQKAAPPSPDDEILS